MKDSLKQLETAISIVVDTFDKGSRSAGEHMFACGSLSGLELLFIQSKVYGEALKRINRARKLVDAKFEAQS